MEYSDYVEILGQLFSEIDIKITEFPDYKIERMAAIIRDYIETKDN
jgi:hypothetical protein